MLLAGLGVVVLAWLLAFALYGLNIVNRWKHRHLPGPKPGWFLGNALRDSDPDHLGPVGQSHVALTRWAAKYGPAFVLYLGRTPIVVLSDPDLIKEAGVKQFRVFHDRALPAFPGGPKSDTEFQAKGIVTAQGRFWSGVRAACEPLFHSTALASYAAPMNQAVDRLVGRLAAGCDSGAGVNISDALAGMTMDVIGFTAFGIDFRAQESSNGEPNPILEAAQVFFQPMGSMSPLLSFLFLGVPHARRLLGRLAILLGAKRLVDSSISRALLWGASQQLLDNARGEAAAAAGTAGGSEGEGQAAGEGGTFSKRSSAAEGQEAPASSGGGGDSNPYGPTAGAAGAAKGGSLEGGGSSSKPSKLQALQAAAFERGRELEQGAVPPSSSIVHRLRNARNQDTGAPLSDLEICAQMFTFMVAGYETTSLALSYALYELAKQPQLQARIAAEADAILGKPGSAGAKQAGSAMVIEYQHLSQLPLTEAAFNEALRMYPPAAGFAALSRWAGETTSIGGYVIPKGGQVVFNAYSLHRDPKHYPDPEAFRPERFLPDNEECQRRHPYAFIPFGVGPRKCVGYKFAIEEGVLALARLLHQFQFEVDQEHHTGPLDLATGITLSVRGGIWLRVRRREG